MNKSIVIGAVLASQCVFSCKPNVGNSSGQVNEATNSNQNMTANEKQKVKKKFEEEVAKLSENDKVRIGEVYVHL